MQVLAVYNTCGISGREPLDWYIRCIDSILSQDLGTNLTGFKVLISSCLNNPVVRTALMNRFGSLVSYNFIDEHITVNASFNHSILKSQQFGEFDWYLYLDSGVMFTEPTQLNKAVGFTNWEMDIATIKVDNDTGFQPWLGVDNPNPAHPARDLPGGQKEAVYYLPVGKACNLHAQLFSKRFVQSYLYKPMPDIFVAYCTESVFSFMCEGSRGRWAILPDIILHHDKSVDGAVSGFDHIGPRRQYWNNLLGNKDIMSILGQQEAWDCGFGYEEMNNVFNHNPHAYNQGGLSVKEPDRLLEFIRTNLYVNKDLLNYNSFKHEFIL